MSRTISVLRVWLPLAVALSGLSALVYGTLQQTLRQGANDPQIQMAEDAAAALDAGAAPASVASQPKVNIARSLAPFLLIYDMDGRPLDGSGLLAGKLPAYPIGALRAALSSGENRVTWQPQPDVRLASVAVPYKAGYVVAGRSLSEVENRVAQIQTLVFLAWIVTLLASLVVAVLIGFLVRSR